MSQSKTLAEAQGFMKFTFYSNAITFLCVIIAIHSSKNPSIYTQYITSSAWVLACLNLAIMAIFMSNGHYLTKGEQHNPTGATTRLVFSIAIVASLAEVVITHIHWKIVLVTMLIVVPISIITSELLKNRFKPLWEKEKS
ncbi:MAG: magnesium-transporting ATPase (P-type) [Alphaproteobacteria bacterium]|jgi:magnesium-transporting ATPase (P-type)